jgi:hypothetical protein
VAVLAIAVFMALVVWAGPFGTGGVKTREAVPATGAGTVVIHDDAGSVNRGLTPGYAPGHDDAGQVGTGLAPKSAPVNYDVGIERPTARTAAVHDDAGFVNR